MHTTPDDYQYDDLAGPSTAAETLPSYDASEAQHVNASSEQPQINRPPPPQDEYAPAPVNSGRPQTMKETSVRLEERLMDPYNLYAYIMDYLRMVPPKPMIRIHGFHKERKSTIDSKKSSSDKRVDDFDISISLEPLLRHALE